MVDAPRPSTTTNNSGLRKRMGFLSRGPLYDAPEEMHEGAVRVEDVRTDDGGSPIREETTESEGEPDASFEADENDVRVHAKSVMSEEEEAEEEEARGERAHKLYTEPQLHADEDSDVEADAPSRADRHSDSGSGSGPSARAWYEFDISVIVALVSPLGNLLTGGDHVRNVLLVMLLIFYLHQLIEIPWSMYHASRPRRRASPSSGSVDPSTRVAASELRRMELLFLSLTVASPLIGALLLKKTATAVLGADTISWFSSALFVLATGIRPWTHLVQRLQDRTADLQEAIHYPKHAGDGGRETGKEVKALKRKMEGLQEGLREMEGRMAALVAVEEMEAHVDEALDGVEKAMRKVERRAGNAGRAAEERVALLEAELQEMRAERLQERYADAFKDAFRDKEGTEERAGAGGWWRAWMPNWIVQEREWYEKTQRRPPQTLSPAPTPAQAQSQYWYSAGGARSLTASGSPKLATILEDEGLPHTVHILNDVVVAPVSPTSPTRRIPALAKRRRDAKAGAGWRVPLLGIVLRMGDMAVLPVRRVLLWLLRRPVLRDRG